jgi:hypothetical protein
MLLDARAIMILSFFSKALNDSIASDTNLKPNSYRTVKEDHGNEIELIKMNLKDTN